MGNGTRRSETQPGSPREMRRQSGREGSCGSRGGREGARRGLGGSHPWATPQPACGRAAGVSSELCVTRGLRSAPRGRADGPHSPGVFAGRWGGGRERLVSTGRLPHSLDCDQRGCLPSPPFRVPAWGTPEWLLPAQPARLTSPGPGPRSPRFSLGPSRGRPCPWSPLRPHQVRRWARPARSLSRGAFVPGGSQGETRGAEVSRAVWGGHHAAGEMIRFPDAGGWAGPGRAPGSPLPQRCPAHPSRTPRPPC